MSQHSCSFVPVERLTWPVRSTMLAPPSVAPQSCALHGGTPLSPLAWQIFSGAYHSAEASSGPLHHSAATTHGCPDDAPVSVFGPRLVMIHKGVHSKFVTHGVVKLQDGLEEAFPARKLQKHRQSSLYHPPCCTLRSCAQTERTA